MTKEELELAKAEIIKTLGKPEYDYDRSALNESARRLNELKGKWLANSRKSVKANKLSNIQNDSKLTEKPILGSKEANEALSRLSGFYPLESDLKQFSGIEKEILKVYLTNQNISHKQLANSFNKSYQWISGFLNSKDVQLLSAKYFHKQLDNHTKLGLLQLTKDADSKVVLAAAEYLKIFHEAEANKGSSKIEDDRAVKALKLVADWLADDNTFELKLTKDMIDIDSNDVK